MLKPFWDKKRNGTVTTPLGFLASGLHCGIKKSKKKYDSSLIVSETPAIAAGTFTTNRVKAWPVLHTMKAMRAPKHRAILASSGNANCVNGPNGKKAVEDAVRETARAVAERFSKVLPPSAAIEVESLSLESIHIHDVHCRFQGTLGEIVSQLGLKSDAG